MKQQINEHAFCDAFITADRKDSFSYDGRKALFEYFEQMEEDKGEEMELDVIAICCDFSEYESATEAVKDYKDAEGFKAFLLELAEDNSTEELNPEEMELWFLDSENEEAIEEHCLEFLNDNTSVIGFDGGIIIQSF